MAAMQSERSLDGDKVKQARKAKGLTQAEAGRKLYGPKRWAQAAWARLENDSVPDPGVAVVRKMARVLDVSIEELLVDS